MKKLWQIYFIKLPPSIGIAILWTVLIIYKIMRYQDIVCLFSSFYRSNICPFIEN